MKKINLTNFIRKDIAGMVAYAPVKYIQQPSEIAKLDAGENQFGYSPTVAIALKNNKFFNYYPDPEYKKIIQTIVKERKRVAEELGKLSYLLVYPSESNSLFIRVNGNILKLKNYLESNKIAVRYYDSEIRLSIGKPEQNNKVIRALQTYEKA